MNPVTGKLEIPYYISKLVAIIDHKIHHAGEHLFIRSPQ